MTDEKTPAPKSVPSKVRDLFERVRNEQHPTLKEARIPVRFAEKKQSSAVKLKRITAPEVREEANCDGVLVICPDWFGKHNPAQVRMGVEDQEADLYREIDIALMGVALPEDEEDGLNIQHPELRDIFKAEAMRYGVNPGTEAYEVVEVLIRRHEEDLNYGEALPSKFAPDEGAQDALPGTQEAADGDSENEAGVDPPEEDAEASGASKKLTCPECGSACVIELIDDMIDGKSQEYTCQECDWTDTSPGWMHEHPDAGSEDEAPEPSSVEDTGKAVDPEAPWGAKAQTQA
jgi:predicted RNA-binding Zn-ribbon protein involved in translation (DUF1610 family)